MKAGRGKTVNRVERVWAWNVRKQTYRVTRANPRTPADEWRLVEIESLYSSGETITNIAQRFGVSRQRVLELLDRADVPRRGCGGFACEF
jgi:hypothetical protein